MNDYSSRPEGAHASGAAARRDEMSLYDVWNVLVRRRWLIVALTALALLAGVVHLLLTPTLYNYRSGIDIGYVYRGEHAGDQRYRLIEPIDAVQARLEDVIIPQVRREQAREQEPVPQVRVEPRAGGGLVLVSRAPLERARDVHALHLAVAEALARRHQASYERELGLVQQQARVQVVILQNQLTVLEEQIAMLDERQQAAGEEAGAVAMVELQRLNDLSRQQAEVQASLARAQALLESIGPASAPTQPSFLATRGESPLGLGVTGTLGLALAFGLMAGVFGAFVWELAATARRLRTERPPP